MQMSDFSTETGIKTVLVVDDQGPVRVYASSVLERAGFLTVVAASGEEAIQIAEERIGRIDMLLTDLQMPGLSGIEVGLRLTTERPELKVLVMSGVERCDVPLPSGWEFIGKPFAPSELLNAITNTLRDQSVKAHCA